MALWEAFKEHMAEDYLHMARRFDGDDQLAFTNREFDLCLGAIQVHLQTMCGRTLEQAGLPSPSSPVGPAVNHTLNIESGYDQGRLAEMVREQEPTLTTDQRSAYYGICRRIEDGLGCIIFLDAPGGTGKTYLTWFLPRSDQLGMLLWQLHLQELLRRS